ncbi:MAG: sugar ABC transporter ATP-binding protein [Pyrinomonadaceae bacterium]|nr:sugar ABC transporter ATP-binding protein [Pyrinomonadaceae bacterium]
MNHNVLLRTENVSKSYDGVHALQSVGFELRLGEIHALVGENGAGKSTLIKIITGAVTPDSGKIELDGKAVTNNSPRLAKSLGIAAIYQQPALFPELTVAENIALGLEGTRSWQLINWNERRQRAAALLEKTGARIDVDEDAGNLTMPEQQLVEIARALGASARVLILDEPTASLSEQEAQNLMRVLRELREQGVGVIYISHRLEELAVLADRVTVLRDGAVVGTRQVSETDQQELIRLMVGRELSAVFPKREVEFGEVVLELRAVGCRSNGLADINLSVRAGEIVGLAGLVGAGRTELARTVFGLDPADSGEIRLRDRAVHINGPTQAIGSGIAYLPEDRRRHGVIMDMSISANITLAALKRLTRWGAFDFDRERTIATDYTRRFAIKTPAIFNAVSTLSGGNQQKVALSRWLATNPAVLILDEPTQGIDVGAKAEIHTLMGELAAQGMAIVMISSELPEILGMSDRIAVMRSGTIAGILNRAEATQHKILELALGHVLKEPVRMSAGSSEFNL